MTLAAQVSDQHELALHKRCFPNMLIMISLPATCRNLQPFLSPLKCYFRAGLMFMDPLVNSSCNWVLDSSKQKFNWKPWFLTKRERKVIHQLTGGGLCYKHTTVEASKRDRLWDVGKALNMLLSVTLPITSWVVRRGT